MQLGYFVRLRLGGADSVRSTRDDEDTQEEKKAMRLWTRSTVAWLGLLLLGLTGQLALAQQPAPPPAAAMRQNQQNKQAAQAQQQALAQYDKAYGVCLDGKGYAVK